MKRSAKGLSRREVLAAAMTAAGVLALGNRVAHAEGSASAKSAMTIGCGTVVFRKLPLNEALDRIRRAGYEYIETQAIEGWCPHVDVWKDDPAAFRRTVEQAGFKGVTAIWSANGAMIHDPKCVEGISQTIRWAKEAGIPVVHAADGWRPDGMSDDDVFKLLAERLPKILETAETCQVYVAIEPHGNYSLTADGLRKILGLSTSKWLGVNYDTANVYRAPLPGAYPSPLYGRAADEVTTLNAVIDCVVHVHVKDVVGTPCVALGEGSVDVAGCVRVLKQHGYAGVLSVETEGSDDADQSQHQIGLSRSYLKGLLDA